MKQLLLPLLGMTPFLLGRGLDWAMMTVWREKVPSFALIGLGMLAFWLLLAYLLGGLAKNWRQAMLLLHLPAAAMLGLLAVQELVLQAYWPNWVGMWSQMFFLPLLRLGFHLTSWSSSAFAAYCAAFLLLLVAALLGLFLRQRRNRRRFIF